MEKIYSGAARVFSWLGVEKEGCAGIDALNLINNEISRLPGVEILLKNIEDGSFDVFAINDLKEKHPAILESATSTIWLVKHHAAGTVANPAAKYFASVHDLFGLPYWSRIWVFQELVLARNIVLVCGKTAAEWSTVCIVHLWILAFRECHSSAELPDEVNETDWFALTAYSDTIDRCDRINKARRAIKLTPSRGSNPSYLDAALFVIRAVLLSIDAHNYRATDAKDYVYGMRAAVRSCIHTDYSWGYTVAQVYQDYVSEWFELMAGAPGQQIGDVGICNLWFLRLAGEGLPMRPVPGLPSWAPNFAGAAELVGKEAKLICKKHANYDTGVFPGTTVVPRLLNTILTCTAAMITEIDAISPIITTSEMMWRRDIGSHEWLLWIYEQSMRLEKLAGRGKGLLIFKDIVHAFSALFKDSMDRDLDIYEQLLIIDLEYACEISTGLRPENFYDSLGLEPQIAANQPARNPQERCRQRWLEADRKDFSNLNKTELGVRPVMDWWFHLHNADGRRLAQLNRLHYGLFPPLIQKGDILALLAGYHLPVILRRSGESYIFVSVCCVPMLADPKRNKELLETGQARLERINII